MKIIRVRKSDRQETSAEDLKKAQPDFNAVIKKLRSAWADITDGLDKVEEARVIAEALPPELKISVYNEFDKASSQASNIVQNIKQLQKRLLK